MKMKLLAFGAVVVGGLMLSGCDPVPGDVKEAMCDNGNLKKKVCECVDKAIGKLGGDHAKAFAITMGGKTKDMSQKDLEKAVDKVKDIKEGDLEKVQKAVMKCQRGDDE